MTLGGFCGRRMKERIPCFHVVVCVSRDKNMSLTTRCRDVRRSVSVDENYVREKREVYSGIFTVLHSNVSVHYVVS